MRPIIDSTQLIGACGLYCGACKKYLSEKCPGCHKHEKATWCRIRKCCQTKGIHTCAECGIEVRDCSTHNNLIGKVFSLLFGSNRAACIDYISRHGEEAFAEKMAAEEKMTVKRGMEAQEP